MLFLHGVGSGKGAWDPQIQALSKQYDCIAADEPGYGESTGTDALDSLDANVAFHLELADLLKLEAFHVVGLSKGAVLAMALALEDPDRVLSITLLGGFAHHPKGAAILEAHKDFAVDPKLYVRSRIPRLLQAPTKEVDTAVATTFEAIDPEVFLRSGAITWGTDLRDQLHRIQCPATILHGTLDQIVPSELADVLEREIPGAVRIDLDLAHLMNLDGPEQVSDALLAALDRHEAIELGHQHE